MEQAGVISPRDAGALGPGLLDGATRPGGREPRRATTDTGATHILPLAERWLPLTVPEVRRLRWWLVWGGRPTQEQVLWGALGRRRHHATANHGHDQRRIAHRDHDNCSTRVWLTDFL
jgi:hypothetical protein